ncbi:MAG: hypothetical protein OER85_04415 [Gammaproteobacteria bacterium]|nr:hypothetical protein [Gammaproteobacteria bacterium]
MVPISANWRTYSVRILIPLGILAIGFVIRGSISVAAWEHTNSDSFGANACHDVYPEEPVEIRKSTATVMATVTWVMQI